MVLITTTLATGVCSGAEMLEVLAIGQVMPGESPIPTWFDADPLVSYVLIPTDIDILSGQGVAGEVLLADRWRRYVRIYFPKNRRELVEGFEFLVFPDGYLDPFTSAQIEDMRCAVEEGMGSFVTMGGDLSGPSKKSYPGWKSSVLSDILPVELVDKMDQDGSGFKVKVEKMEPALISMFIPLGIERVTGSGGFTDLYPKPGTTIWGRMVLLALSKGDGNPWLVSRRYGPEGGYSWAIADDLDHPWWSSVHSRGENEYGMDLFLNILLFSTGRNLPDDILLLHEVRDRYWRHNQRKELLLSLLEFVDRFGANTRSLQGQIEEVDRLKLESFEFYRLQEYENAISRMDEARDRISAISDGAVELKETALFWVYLTEWCVVAGTSFAVGLVTYALLVKRGLYREVKVTRSR